MGENKRGKVYLVGAGPGDPGLITVKGRECIARADALVYDRLAGPRLLAYARPDARLYYVGKSPQRHALKQEEINALLVELAGQGLVVTRLKGGDPFVFGRGGEEALALARAGIEFEVVPGVTSAVAVPAYAGIPVTQRGMTSTLGIVTGNEDPGKESTDLDWAGISSMGTVVFLMGMANLPAIVRQLLAHGRSPDTPVAVIRWGTRPEQAALTGTLADIVDLVREHNFTNPAVIVVGQVVSLREQLAWFEKKPLFGRRVLVTRSREQASALCAAVEQLGGEPIEFPVIQIVDPESYAPLDRAIARIRRYHWIIFTSANGVRYFFRRLWEQGGDVRDLQGINIAAIGPQTRLAVERYGIRVAYVPEEYRAEAVVDGLRGGLQSGQAVLLPRADIARDVLPRQLRQMGLQVDEVTAYRTVAGAGNADMIRELLQAGQIDYVTFTSSSTVRNFVSALNHPDLPGLLQSRAVKVAAIGPVTAQTARELGLPVHIQAGRYTIEGLLEAIVNDVRGSV
ncbi:uroporphyrinogen-III C-methyltransferase [Desulfurispora thermophila]|uniref:uroporphyrinogen-III C-methyltransferase n=1 Tax=Desulfurispora thermophila TaxID=265470 RepID=UPI00036C1C17|nr:uroporphyrinogen-III C-methyltransferase [Desulfurispora thermophila]